MMRKVLALCLVMVLSLSAFGGLGVSAAQDNGYEKPFILYPSAKKEITVFLDGAQLQFDVPPQLINGRTMVPLRVIFEALGASVYWDDATQTVTARKGETVVELSIGAKELYNSGTMYVLDTPACLVEGRTLVPARAVSEAFGMLVGWDDATYAVTIDTPATPAETAPAANIYEAAHRKLKAFISSEGEWDEAQACFWKGYGASEGAGSLEFDMYYSARGARLTLSVKVENESAWLELGINETNYPIYRLVCADGREEFERVGEFLSPDAPAKMIKDTFYAADAEAAMNLSNVCFYAMDTFLKQTVGMNLAECGVYYQNPTVTE